MTSTLRRGTWIAAGIAAILALAGTAPAATAHEYTAGNLTVFHPWAAATPPGATTAGAYMVLKNKGKKALKLLKITTDVAEKVEIHSMKLDHGVMKMRPQGALTIPAHGELKLNVEGFHIMLVGLKKPLVEEEMIPATLIFKGAPKMNVELYVEAIGETNGHHGH